MTHQDHEKARAVAEELRHQNEVEALVEAEGRKIDAEYERKALEIDLLACDVEPMGDEGDPDDLDAWKK